jgi:hypothetical protein
MIKIAISVFGIQNLFGGDFAGILEVARIADRSAISSASPSWATDV